MRVVAPPRRALSRQVLTRRVALLAGPIVALSIALAGCATTTPEPMPRPTAESATPTPTPTPEPPKLNLDGTAAQNLKYFDLTNQTLIDSGVALSGGAFVDSLVVAGFPREDIEVTPDKTTVGVAADSVMFSVRLGDTCLLGQWGNIGYASDATKVLATGLCLVGTPHPAG